MTRRLRDAVLLWLAVVYGGHVLTTVLRFWLSKRNGVPTIHPSMQARIVQDMFR